MLQCDYKVSTFKFSAMHQKIYLFNILCSPYSKQYTALYSGGMLDKETYS